MASTTIDRPAAGAAGSATGATERPAVRWFHAPQLTPAPCVPEESVGAYDLLERYGAAAMKQERLLVNNPAPIGEEDARRLYEAAR